MGGYGSGRTGRRVKVEACRSLDVNRLHREGCLVPGWTGRRQWTRDGERVAWMGLAGTAGGLRLTYRVREGGEEWEDVAYTVPLTWVPCAKSRARPYFLCPGSRAGRHCGRRVAKLYGASTYFLCRHCYRLTYASRSEDWHDRLIRRRERARRAVNPQAGFGDFPPRLKGMWRRTYEARLDRLLELEDAPRAPSCRRPRDASLASWATTPSGLVATQSRLPSGGHEVLSWHHLSGPAQCLTR